MSASNVGKALRIWPKVVLYGDSITQQSFSVDGCWGSLLANHLQRKCDIVCRGFSGYNTKWNKIMLPTIFDASVAKDTVAFTLFLGANDSNFVDLNPRQHVPLEEYKQNLKDMIEYIMSVGLSRDKIILITPPAFNAKRWEVRCIEEGMALSKDNEITGVYAKACSAVATEMGTKVVDLYAEMMKAEDFHPYLNDGLHLSPKGSELLFSLLKPHIDQLTSHLPDLIFPYFKDIDLENPEKSLLES